MKKLLLTAVASGAMLSGCVSTVVESRKLTTDTIAGAKIGNDAGAITYFLPRQRAQIIAKGYTIDATLIASAKKDMHAAEDLVKLRPKDEDAAEALKKAQSDYTKLKNAKNECRETATITLLPVEADMNHRFQATFKHKMSRNDTYTLRVDENGLLAGGDATTTDQTLDILEAIASTAAAFAGGPSTNLPLLKAAGKNAPNCPTYSYSKIFDPTDTDIHTTINTELRNKGAVEPNSIRVKITVPSKSKASPKKGDGLYYRRGGPVTFEIGKGDPIAHTFSATSIAHHNIPQAGPIGLIPVKGGAFITTKFEYDFVNGQPTRLNVERPSEALAVAGFPLEVAKSIISTPTELIQLKVNHSTQEAALLEAQKAVIDAQAALLGNTQATSNSETTE